MKTIQKFSGIMLLIVLVVAGFSACGPGESIEERMLGRVWSGNIGMTDEAGEPVNSVFQFFRDGSGQEDQYYLDNTRYKTFYFNWDWENSYTHNLVLDYRQSGSNISYMDNVYVDNGVMTGTFYVYSDGDGFAFRLYMQ